MPERFVQTAAAPAPACSGGLEVERPDHAWRVDTTYIPAEAGLMCLVAVMDRPGRLAPLSWRPPNTANADLRVVAFDGTPHRSGEMSGADQGIQVRQCGVAGRGGAAGAKVSMDVRGPGPGNAFIERLALMKRDCGRPASQPSPPHRCFEARPTWAPSSP